MAKKILSALQALKDPPLSQPPSHKSLWGIAQLCLQPAREIFSADKWKKHSFKILTFSVIGLFIIHKIKSLIPQSTQKVPQDHDIQEDKSNTWIKFAPLSYSDLKSQKKAAVRAETSSLSTNVENTSCPASDEKKLEESLSENIEQVQKYRNQLFSEKERKKQEAEQACQRVKEILSPGLKPMSLKGFFPRNKS